MVNNLIILLSLNRILPFVSIILGLITIYFLIFLSQRIRGKLSRTQKFLTAAIAIFIIQAIFIVLDLFNAMILESIISITNFFIILFVLLAVLTLRFRVNEIDRNHDNLKRKLKKKA